MYRCSCGGRFLKLEEELVCDRCGRTYPYENSTAYHGKVVLGSIIGRGGMGIFSTSENYMRRYANIFLRSEEEKREYRLKQLAERLENLLGLPSYLRDDAIKLLMKRTPSTSLGALAYAYVMAARMKGNWAISWHTVHKKLRELGIRADIEEVSSPKTFSTYFNYIPKIAEKAAFTFKERLTLIGINPHVYCRKLTSFSNMLLKSIDRTKLNGRSPFSIAVTVVYLSEHEWAKEDNRRPIFTQFEIAKLSGISVYTIRETGSLIRRLLSEKATVDKPIIKLKV